MSDVLVTSLSKAYGTTQALFRISVCFPEGKTTAIMAPSGAGKTTLLRLLMGLESPDEGTIQGLEGKQIAAVFQENRLCEPFCALDQLTMVNPALKREDAMRAMQRFLLPMERRAISEYSGGMKRRVALLRALLAPWDWLLLDEPFTGLDEETKGIVMGETRRMTQGKSVILVTHDRLEAEALEATVIEWPMEG